MIDMEVTAMQTRYTAEWIAKQHFDESGEWLPDRDEREFRSYRSLAAAQKGGRIASKKAGCVPWVRVAEEQLDTLDDCFGLFTRWDEVRVWHGEWEGEWEEQ
jgi:hypothetical protein